VPTLDLAAIELGGEGFPLPVDGGTVGLKGTLGTPEVGGVARLPLDENVGEKGGSDF
jgi:hypothetical protein